MGHDDSRIASAIGPSGWEVLRRAGLVLPGSGGWLLGFVEAHRAGPALGERTEPERNDRAISAAAQLALHDIPAPTRPPPDPVIDAAVEAFKNQFLDDGGDVKIPPPTTISRLSR